MRLTITVHKEEGSYWSEINELPGCFASGHTLDELWASIQESIELYLTDDEKESRGVQVGVPRLDEFQVHV